MLDSDFAEAAFKHFSSFTDALQHYWDVNETRPYNAQDATAAFKKAEQRLNEFLPFVTTRLDQLAVRYLQAGQGDWQVKLSNELQPLWPMSGEDLRAYGLRVHDRYNRFLNLRQLVSADLAHPGESASQPLGPGIYYGKDGSVQLRGGDATPEGNGQDLIVAGGAAGPNGQGGNVSIVGSSAQEPIGKESPDVVSEREAKVHQGMADLDSREIAILEQLSDAKGRLLTQIDLEGFETGTRKTIALRLRRLASLQFVDEPKGPKKGWAITGKGQEWLSNYHKKSSQ